MTEVINPANAVTASITDICTRGIEIPVTNFSISSLRVVIFIMGKRVNYQFPDLFISLIRFQSSGKRLAVCPSEPEVNFEASPLKVAIAVAE